MHHLHHSASHEAAFGVARGLGWFSIALGLAQLAAPQPIARSLGMRGSERMIQACGMGKIAAGAGILASNNPAPWLWGRVAGDAVDLAALATGLHHGNRQRRNVQLAMAAVGAATLLDIFAARRTGEAAELRFLPSVDYSDRSGLPQGVQAARGAAAGFDPGRHFRTPEALRPWKDGKPQNGWSEPGGGAKIANSNVSSAVARDTSVLGSPGGEPAGKAAAGGDRPLQQAAGSHDRDKAFRTGPTFTGSGNEGP